MSRYIALKPLNPGKAVEVLERDDKGVLVGAWFGYWNFKKGTVALYPNVANHNVNWPGGVIPKGRQVISDRSVKRKENAECGVQNAELKMQNAECRVQKDTSSAAQSAPSSLAGEGDCGVQQQMKFY